MQIVFFFALWLVIALGVPAIVHVLFGSSEYIARSRVRLRWWRCPLRPDHRTS